MSASCLRQMILSALPTILSLLFLSPRPIYNRHLIVYTEFLKRDLMQTLTNISSCPYTPKAKKKKKILHSLMVEFLEALETFWSHCFELPTLRTG